MDRQTAELLLIAAREIDKMADTCLSLSGNAHAASIIRRASWCIRDTVPAERRAEDLLRMIEPGGTA